MFKLSSRVPEAGREIEALRIWAGEGAARLLEADDDRGALLLEGLAPGTMLTEVDDDRATHIAANLLRELWVPAPARSRLETLDQRFAAYERNRGALGAGTADFPRSLFERADALRAELLASVAESFVLHGDLHHFNILRAQRAEWLAIDPHGLVGERGFDICQFLRNPEPTMPLAVNRRRVDTFCSELGLDRRRTKDWCVVHAVLDACWSFEDENPDLAERVAYAETMLDL